MSVKRPISGWRYVGVWVRSCRALCTRALHKLGRFLMMLWAVSHVGYADDGDLMNEVIPKQKMVMSRYRSRNQVGGIKKRVDDGMVVQAGGKGEYNADQIGDRGQLDSWIAQEASLQEVEVNSGVVAGGEELMPYAIIPEQGQKEEVSKKDMQLKRELGRGVKKTQVVENYTFNRVTQWVNEVGMNMFTYSGEHLNRDRNNASRYFSPEAWQVVEQFLFHRTDSPFLHLKKERENSRGMTLDWPVSLSTDMTKRGKIWWVKVPVSALIKGKGYIRRAFFEVKLGVLPVEKRDEEVRFIAQEVIIKQMMVQQKKRDRRE